MTMKKTELEKRKGLVINNALRAAGNPYGPASASPQDRKARREAERAAGLVPFAIKLDAALAAQLRELAQSSGRSVDEVCAELLARGLAA